MIETASPGGASTSSSAPTGGFSAAAALVLVGTVTVVVAMLSAATGRGFGLAFNLAYFLVTVYAAVRVHVEGRFATVVGPPLIYAIALLAGGFVDSQEPEHGIQRVIENTFVNLSFGAPWLVGTTMLVIVIAILRGRRATVRGRH